MRAATEATSVGGATSDRRIRCDPAIAGVALVIVGVAVAVHTIIEPLYHVSSEVNPYSLIWTAINPATALAVVLGMIFGYARKRAAGPKR